MKNDHVFKEIITVFFRFYQIITYPTTTPLIIDVPHEQMESNNPLVHELPEQMESNVVFRFSWFVE
jgi:hypothetical protein